MAYFEFNVRPNTSLKKTVFSRLLTPYEHHFWNYPDHNDVNDIQYYEICWRSIIREKCLCCTQNYLDNALSPYDSNKCLVQYSWEEI